jgi:hypothetical protein
MYSFRLVSISPKDFSFQFSQQAVFVGSQDHAKMGWNKTAN